MGAIECKGKTGRPKEMLMRIISCRGKCQKISPSVSGIGKKAEDRRSRLLVRATPQEITKELGVSWIGFRTGPPEGGIMGK